ncbi:flavodoxin family protein [Clostridia bacterium]|nr:flavodoxin family protein [Clostridia bacterium]
MKFLMISGNPKQDGLCASIEAAIKRGAEDAGASFDKLDVLQYLRCQVCNQGWGTCREGHECVLAPKDGFDKAQEQLRSADAICMITPVYWGEMAEGLKCFVDRMRRCEFGSKALAGKYVLLVASPGGSGNGAVTCLDQMDRFCRHTGMTIFDYISINRWNHDYKERAAYEAAKAIASGRKHGETV